MSEIQARVKVPRRIFAYSVMPQESTILLANTERATTTTTTTSLFQIKYSLQGLCPQLAKAIRGGYKRKRKIV